jgi:hypothetical protein
MPKNQLATSIHNTNPSIQNPNPLLIATIFDKDNAKLPEPTNKTNTNASSRVIIEGNIAVEYENYIKSLGNVKELNANGSKVIIKSKSRESFEVVTISYKEFIIKVQQGNLPTQEDYILKYESAKSQSTQDGQEGKPIVRSLDLETSTTIASNYSVTSDNTVTPTPVALDIPAISDNKSEENNSGHKSDNLSDSLKGSFLLQSIKYWNPNLSVLRKSSILGEPNLGESTSEAEQDTILKELIIRSYKIIGNTELEKRVLASLNDSENLDNSAVVSEVTKSSFEAKKP